MLLKMVGQLSSKRVDLSVQFGEDRHAGTSASIEARAGGQAVVSFDEPVRAVAPGQAAVFYDGDVVLGGGWIAESL